MSKFIEAVLYAAKKNGWCERRKKVQTLLLVIMTAALFTAPFSMAEETGTKEAKKQEEVKKRKQKAKKHKPAAKRGDAGENRSKSSEGSGITSDVNRAGKKVMDAAHSGVEAVKDGLNEGYDKLKNKK